MVWSIGILCRKFQRGSSPAYGGYAIVIAFVGSQRERIMLQSALMLSSRCIENDIYFSLRFTDNESLDTDGLFWSMDFICMLMICLQKGRCKTFYLSDLKL